MLRSTLQFLMYGIVWLFLFSIPIGHHNKSLYQVGHYYIVDTRPVHMVIRVVEIVFRKTNSTADHVVNEVTEKVDK
jgi:hypothetical protein